MKNKGKNIVTSAFLLVNYFVVFQTTHSKLDTLFLLDMPFVAVTGATTHTHAWLPAASSAALPAEAVPTSIEVN
jgi:hypothetical protein